MPIGVILLGYPKSLILYMDNLPYNKNLVGKFIAIGAENVVYSYNEGREVIKFPTFFSLRYNWNSQQYCKEIQDGYEMLKKYLPERLNKSNLHIYERSGKMTYLILEPFIHGKALSKNDLKNGDVKRQFLEIIAAKNQLESKENLFVDLFGSWGLWLSGRWKISNLLLDKQNQKLYLVDIGTARINDGRFIIRILVRLAKRIQDNLLKKYLNYV